MLAGNGVVRVLEVTEQERDVLALTDAVIHPASVFNPIVHNANHHIGSQWIVHGQKETAGGGSILLVKAVTVWRAVWVSSIIPLSDRMAVVYTFASNIISLHI